MEALSKIEDVIYVLRYEMGEQLFQQAVSLYTQRTWVKIVVVRQKKELNQVTETK